jgi:nitric oxide reductase NorD protein
MAVDEALFGRLHRWWTRRRERRRADTEVALATAAGRWQKLATLLSGRDLTVTFGSGPATLRANFVLPPQLPRVGSVDDATAVAMLRLAIAAAAEHLQLDARSSTLAAAWPRLWGWLDAHWPATRTLQPIWQRYAGAQGLDAAASLALLGELPQPAAAMPPRAAADQPLARDALPDGTERQKRTAGRTEVVEVEVRDDGANPLAHVFEKVRTAEEHTGGNRAMDGSDELDAHQEALDELDLRRVVRSRHRTASVFAADVEFAATAADLVAGDAGPALREYDEWDERSRRYLPRWCKVYAVPAQPAASERTGAWLQAVRARHGVVIRQLRAEFARLVRGATWLPRQPTGSDLDLDAIVQRHGDLAAARRSAASVGEGRLYTARRPAPRDVAVLVLLDRSLSSDSWVAGRRVLDTTREAVLVLGEALAGLRLPMAVGAFCSHTRNDCRFATVAEFAGDWAVARHRLLGLEPDGYTRIGPAIRHATSLLTAQPAQRRLLLVCSDCKPVDYDLYEGRRGIGDVRQAVREAQRAGVATLALAVERSVPPHLPRMFGPRGFRVLRDAAQLAAALARLHERLLRP